MLIHETGIIPRSRGVRSFRLGIDEVEIVKKKRLMDEGFAV
jgi:hypothetical protein